MGMKETELAFFDACETGKGWAGCHRPARDVLNPKVTMVAPS